MIGSCIINGVDIATWDMFILKDSDSDFLSFPDRKEPTSNNWQEYDGLDVDLTEVYFNAKKVVTRFFIKADTGAEFLYRLNAFHTLISAPGTLSLYSREFDRTFLLRFISCPEYRHTNGMYKDGTKRGEITVEFSMDNPLQLFNNPALFIPTANRNTQFVSINNYDLGRFGIIVNECYNTTLKLPAVKPPLVQSFERSTGLFVTPSSQTTFEATQVTIECTMLADTREEFYHNYEALFNNLTKTDAVQLSTFSFDADCFYNSMQNFEKLKPFSDGVRVRFSLILTLITPGLIRFLLGTQDNYFINTQDNYFIQM